jgi:hypothetical protein
MNMNVISSARQGAFAKKRRGTGLALLAMFTWLAVTAAAGPSGFVLQTRPDYFGDPYLSTNAAGQVSLVMNKELSETNAEYQAKVSALAARETPDAGDARSFLAAAVQKAAEVRTATARLFHQSPSPAAGTGPPQTSPSSARSPSAANGDFQEQAVQLSYKIQRWLLFTLVSLFLLRRIWRYFREVRDDDDFSNRLTTLAAAHRWIFPVYIILLAAVAAAEFMQIGNLFFSLSVLMLASSLRGYYCEGDFADFPKCQKVHLGLSLLLVALGWSVGFDNYLADLSTWSNGHGLRAGILGWILLALLTRALRGFVNGPDLEGQRAYVAALLAAFLFTGSAGSVVGGLVWVRIGWRDSVWHGCAAGASFAAFLLGAALFVSRNPVFLQVMGGTAIDMFLPRFFGQKVFRQRHLPSLLLLQHWREHGDVEKAWQTAQAHLVREPRALPLWLFALETSVLFRRQPGDALPILNRLCTTDAFSHDHRMVAVAKMEEWMSEAGFAFDRARFNIERPPLEPTALAGQIEQKCRDGQASEAAAMLRAVLAEDSLNEAAFIQLIRIYCQDLKNRRGAEQLIVEASETFSPKLLAYLGRTLDEWIQLPIRSTVQRKGFLHWLFPPAPKPPRPEKLSVTAPPITQKPRTAETDNGMDSYLERVRLSHGKPPDTSGIFDPAERLLAERRLGTAVELIKKQAEAAPDDFEVWLRYAEAHGHHCGDPAAAEKIIRQMERSGRFKKAQMKKAHNRLKKWWKQHATHENNW